jgi:hypothetical protein
LWSLVAVVVLDLVPVAAVLVGLEQEQDFQ